MIIERPVRFRNPRRQFLADPLRLAGTDDEYLVEQYRFTDRKGVISHLRLHHDGRAELCEGVIEESFHLSFPMSFVYEGRTLVVAEAHRGGATFLWELRVAERSSRRIATIVNEPLRDIAIFESRFGWHLVATRLSPTEQLVHFRADSPFGRWEEAPIVNRADQERLAGVPVGVGPEWGGDGFPDALLPLQGHSRGYGTEIAVARLNLDIDGAAVVDRGQLVDPPKPFLGVHSLAMGSSSTLIDLKHLQLRTDRIRNRLRPARVVARVRRAAHAQCR